MKHAYLVLLSTTLSAVCEPLVRLIQDEQFPSPDSHPNVLSPVKLQLPRGYNFL